MVRVMRDATVAATATKLFTACGPSGLGDGYLLWQHWLTAVRAWSVGATRSLPCEDRDAIVKAICVYDEDALASDRHLEGADEDDD